jgi:hypothetical protein
MDHLSTRLLARYALGEITDDAELTAFEEHLMECESCRRRAMAVDLIGTMPDGPEEGNEKPQLHIAANGGEVPTALCGGEASRNIISEMLLPGLDATLVCSDCLARLRAGTGGFVN